MASVSSSQARGSKSTIVHSSITRVQTCSDFKFIPEPTPSYIDKNTVDPNVDSSFQSENFSQILLPAAEFLLTTQFSELHEHDMLQDILISISAINFETADLQTLSENDVATSLTAPPSELVTLSRSESSFFFLTSLVNTVIVQNIWATLQRDLRFYQVSFPEVAHSSSVITVRFADVQIAFSIFFCP